MSSVRSKNRVFLLFGALSLIFSLLAPVMTIEAARAAQDLTTRQEPVECDEGFVLDPATDTCIPEDPQATGDLQAEPTPTPDIGEPPAPPSRVDVTVWECPSHVDPLADWSDLTSLCTTPASTDLTITHGVNGGGEVVQVTSGTAMWVGLPPGTHYLYATPPAGTVTPAVWCGPYIEGVSLATLSMMTVQDGTTIVHELGPGQSLYCDWFTIQAPSTTGYVQVHHRLCPDGIDAAVATITDLQNECVEPGVGTTFSVQGDAVELSSAMTDASGTAQLGEIPADDIMLVADVPAAYPESIVYCFADYAFQPLEHSYTEEDRMSIVGSSVAWSLAADDMLECYWYSIGADAAVGDLVAQDDPDALQGGTLLVEKYRCPLGVVEDASSDDYQEICTQVHDGVEFTVTHAGGSFPDVTVGGQVSWAGIPVGDYQLQETIPAGFKDPLVFCAWSVIPDGGFGIIEHMDAPDGLVELTVPGDGWENTCQVFNIPDETANTLTVRKFLCPAGFDGDEAEAADECTEPQDGVTFVLGDMEADTGAWGPGTAVFADVPAGNFDHTEIVPEGIGEVIYDGCHLNGAPAITIVLGTEPPSTTLSFSEGDHWECWWYNVPVVDYDVVIHKYVCTPGTEFIPPNAIPGFAQIQAACPEEMDGIPFTIEHDEGSETLPTTDGSVVFHDLPAGTFAITEELPDGFVPALWYCSFLPTGGGALPQPEFIPSPGGEFSAKLSDPAGGVYTCFVYNFPDDDRSVLVWKWACPAGLQAESEDFQDWADTCVNHPPGIDFTVTDANGDSTRHVAGMQWWAPVAEGEVSITEHTPPGYQEPIVFCGLEAYSLDGAAFAEGLTMMPVTGSTVSRLLDHPFFTWECHFFNVPKPQGEVIINKFRCPEVPGGYDPTGMGADPTVDCTEPMNDVTFTLTPQMGGAAQMQDTGDVIGGAVIWNALDPGVYTIAETLPADVDSAFIWSCTGSNIPAVHPQPLNIGMSFQIEVAPGDEVICDWYNVSVPDEASVTVYKYLCWTPVFVSEVDCEIYEFGATFELVRRFDDSSYGVKVTDAFGTATWSPVDPGVHELVELDGEACHVELSQDDGNGNPMVDMGEETVVHVYNCADDSSTPGGKIPERYPNTGVPGSTVVMPLIQATPSPDAVTAEYFPVRCLPAEATPASGTDDCPRGAIPEHIVIEAIGIDHEFENVEVVDGVMQAPSGPDVASWYKESGRLGEANNTLVAGHLNYWGVPEGIFFSLHTLGEGDVIEVTGHDGRVYVYEVEWVRMESNLAPPAADVVAATNEASLTLITCGGSWNAAISEYDQRTVVRAVLVEVFPAA